MTNPYESSSSLSPEPPRFRSVRSLVALSLLFALASFHALATGFRLLNQELGVFSVSYATYDIEINGRAVSNEMAIAETVLAGLLLLSIALVLAFRARRNFKCNASLAMLHTAQAEG